MKLAFSKPTPDEQSRRELFTGFRAAGFGGLQLKGGQYAPYLDDPAGFIRAWGDDPALTSGLITMGTLDDAGVAALRRVIAFGAATHAQRVVFCHDHPREGVTDDDLRRFAAILSGLGEEAAARGVTLSLHHHFQQPVMHRRDFEVFFSTAEHVGLTVDTGHLAKSGITDPAGLLRDFAGVLDNVHLKDFEQGEWRILGRGTLDFPSMFAALSDTGYDGWLCVDEESTASMSEGLSASWEFLSAFRGDAMA